VTTGVLLMAHGTPSSPDEIGPFYTRIRRGRPPTPEQLAELEGRYRAIVGVSPLAEHTRGQVEGVRAVLEHRAPGHFVVSFGAKHTDPLIEEAAAALAVGGHRHVIGLVLTPHASSLGSQEYLERAAAALADTPFVAVEPWYAEPALVELLASRVKVLYDLDVDVAGVAAASGLAYARTASLNDDPVFVRLLADLVVAADFGR